MNWLSREIQVGVKQRVPLVSGAVYRLRATARSVATTDEFAAIRLERIGE